MKIFRFFAYFLLFVFIVTAKSRLEMELLRQRIGITQSLVPPLVRSRCIPPFQDSRAYGDTLGAAFARASMDSFDCPFHFNNRRRPLF